MEQSYLRFFVRFESEKDGEVVREVGAEHFSVGEEEIRAGLDSPGQWSVCHSLEGSSVGFEVATVIHLDGIHSSCSNSILMY